MRRDRRVTRRRRPQVLVGTPYDGSPSLKAPDGREVVRVGDVVTVDMGVTVFG